MVVARVGRAGINRHITQLYAGRQIPTRREQVNRRVLSPQREPAITLIFWCVWQGHPARIAITGHHQVTKSEEHTSELPSLMRIPYAVFCLKNKIDYHKSSANQSTY